MAAGFKYAITINGVGINFKNARGEKVAPFIEGSAKFNPDGSVNLGYTAKYSDLKTFMMEAEGLFSTAGLSPVPALALGENLGIAWSFAYNGILQASGTGLYVERYSLIGSIPGEGRASILMYSNGPWA